MTVYSVSGYLKAEYIYFPLAYNSAEVASSIPQAPLTIMDNAFDNLWYKILILKGTADNLLRLKKGEKVETATRQK